MLSPIMTLCAYRLADALAFTAFPGKRRNATRRHMAKERARYVISDHVVTCDEESRSVLYGQRRGWLTLAVVCAVLGVIGQVLADDRFSSLSSHNTLDIL
jgi:hypothetical protein